MSQQDKLQSWLACTQCVHEPGEKYGHDADGIHILRNNIRDVYHIDSLDRDRLTSLECIKTKTRPAAVANDDSPVSRKRALESEATEQSNSPGVSTSKKKIVRQGRSPSPSITCVPSTPSVALSKATPSISQSGVGAGHITPVTTRA